MKPINIQEGYWSFGMVNQ